MASTYWQAWQQQQQQNQLNALAQQQNAGAGADPYLVQLAQQGQNGQFPPPTNSTGPYMGQQQPPPKPSAGQQVAGTAGQLGGQMAGTYAAQQGMSALTGSGAATVAPAATGGMTGVTGTSAMGSIGGSGAASTAAGATATESALGIGAAGAQGSAVGGATTFATAEAATAAGYTAVGTAAEGGVIAVPASTASTWGAYAGPAALAALGVATAYQSYQNYGAAKDAAGDGAMTDDEVATIYDPWREPLQNIGGETAPGFLKEAHNAVFDNMPHALIWKSVMGSGKHEDQIYRERTQSSLKKMGFLDKDSKYTLADGSQFDFGVDGKHTLQNTGANIDGKTERRRYDIDFSDPRAGYATAALQGLGAIMANGENKQQRDVTGKLVNAALSSGDSATNIQKMIEDAGFKGHDEIYSLIHTMSENKAISKEFADSVKNGLDEFYGVGAYADGAAPSQMPDAFAPKNKPGTGPQAGAPRDPGMGNGMAGSQPPRNSGTAYGNGTAQGSYGNVMPMLPAGGQVPAGFGGPKDNNVKPYDVNTRDPKVAIRAPNASANPVQKPVPTAPSTKPRVSPWIASQLNTRAPGLVPRGEPRPAPSRVPDKKQFARNR